MAFPIGSEVRSISDPSRIGIIKELGPFHAGLQYYVVFWGGLAGTTKVSESDLRLYQPAETPKENLIQGNLAGYQEFQRLITYQRLKRNFPLRNNIYAFNASRTRFYPYQFKPLVKFLDSPNHRLLICDEVGLGKTIEAGLILTELRARQTVRRVLIVCPANLTKKWQNELKTRFDEDFQIYKSVENFIAYLEEYREKLDQTILKGIISLETIRNDKVLQYLEILEPHFDLVIIDEAHHMRNFGRKQRKAGEMLSSSADAMIMLTATPIHLGNKNLFSLLNILDDEDFRDQSTTDERFRQNEPIIQAQICLGQIPPKISEAITLLDHAKYSSSFWICGNPLYPNIMNGLQQFAYTAFDRKKLVNLQRDLSELNLIGHIFTRTRKREVHENVAQRRAHALKLSFSEKERSFYDIVTQFVRAESETRGDLSVIQQWRLNLPQRRMASSIPAMIEHYRDHFGFDADDQPEDFDEMIFDEDEEMNAGSLDFTEAERRLQQIVKNWPIDEPDSKYNKFLEILKNTRVPTKIIVFAFFKGTLKYLNRRLRQDGFGSLLISGDIQADDRPTIIEQFRTDPDIQVLLSSRVGSEGLDFQFCDKICNYDLPWNPMELEQRIGRIDRIGQESKVIQIYNLWIENTIEERILKRLYERIGIFKHSIGELEMIVGDIVHQLEKDVFSKFLTPEEEIKQADQAITILERKKQDLEKLEQDAAQFIGTDAYFEEEVKAIRMQRRYVTSEQLRRFVVDFLKNKAPQTRLEYDRSTNKRKLFPDADLRDFIIKHRKSAELSLFLSNRGHGVEVTFDAQVAFQNPNLEFLSVLHPLVMAITAGYDETINKTMNAQHVVLRTKSLEPGFYYYFIFRLRIRAAREENTLECVILNEALQEACDPYTAETIFGEMLEQGEDPQGVPLEINPQNAEEACAKAEKVFLERVQRLRAEIERNNDSFIERRLVSLNTFYERKLKKLNDLLKQGKRTNKEERYIRMLEGTIRRLENELEEKRDELQRLRNIGDEHDEIAGGILETIDFAEERAKTADKE